MPIRTPTRPTTTIALVLIILFASGCGQKGDLYLPYDATAVNANF